MYEIYQGISHPGCIPAYPGYGYMIRDIYETITSSHLTLQTKQGRIKNFKLSGVTRQVESPSPDTPQDIQGVGVRTAQLANLPDIAPTTSNGLTWGCKDGVITVTGTAQKNSDSTTVGLYTELHLQPGTYKVSGYDTDVEVYVRITRADDKTTYYQGTPFVTEATDKLTIIYAQVPTGKTVNKTICPMLNAGNTALPYEPYGYRTDVVTRSKNLLDRQRMLDFILQKSGASIVQFDGRRCLKLDGGFNFPDFNLYEDFEPEKRYTLTFDGFYEKYKTEAFLGNGFAFTLQNGGRNLSLLDVSDIGTWKHKTTTSDTGVTKLTFTYGASSVVYIDLDTIQLEEGTISTPYQPYAYYTAPIYTRDPVYQGDKIEYRNGEYGLVRKNGLLTDNGAMAWTKYSYASWGVNRCFSVNVPDMIYYANSMEAMNAKPELHCNRLLPGGYVGRDIPVSVGYSEQQIIYIHLDDDKYTGIDTTAQFKAWLADHPVEILYPLDQETWEPLPAISQQALRNLPTYKGTTIIDTTDPLEPEITVSYRPQTDYSKLPGLEADYEKGIFTRLGAAKNLTAGTQFNRFPMYAGRRRCNVLDDGTITAYYGDPDYKEDGSNGQVMVYQPKFYYQVVPLKLEPQTDGIGYHLRRAQYWVSPKPQPGFKLHPAFLKPAQKLEYIMYAAFEGSIYDTSAAAYILDDAQVMDVAADKLSSIAGAKPASGKTQQFTRPNVEQLAQNRGSGWHGDTIKAESANQLLMAIELGTMNTQAAIGQGVASIPDTPNTENNSIITGGTSSLGSNTGMADGTNGKVSVAYRGVENPWGNIWKQVYGVNIWGDGSMKGGVPYICTDYDFAESKDTGNYESAGFTLANANGYISAMGYSEACDWLFLPSETLGNSFMPVGDYYYCIPDLNGYRISLLGSSWFGGDIAGGFFWGLNNGVGGRSRGIGSRLIYVPQ